MHELALAQSVVQIACEEAARHRLARVERLRIEVGLLRGVVPAFLQSCIGFASRGTPVERAAVEIVEVAGRARCPSCASEFPVEELPFLCPRCEALGGEVLAGAELRLIELEGE